MSWTANNKYYLTGSITSGLTLSDDNADSGTVPTDMSVLTYNDETYNDSTYEITAIYEGTYESSFSTNDVNWISTGDSNDIKYQVATSDDGVTYSDYSTLADAIGTTQIAVNASYFKLRFIFYSSFWSDSDSIQIADIIRKFTVFNSGGDINANEWMSNYYVVGQENFLPRGGSTLSPTNSVYNLGSSSHKWNNIFINNLPTVTSISDTFNLISNITLSSAANSIEFTGLGTVSDTTYYLTFRLFNDTSSTDDITLFFNNDSSTTYGKSYFKWSNSSESYDVAGTQSGIDIGQCATSTGFTTFESYINVFHSNNKFLIGYGGFSDIEQTAGSFYIVSGTWNSQSTVTSIKIYCDSKFDIGSEVSLWRKF